MKIAIAQINSTLGAFRDNGRLILENIQKAKDQECDLVIFPECSFFGYQPMDLLERTSVVSEQVQEFKAMIKDIPPGISAIIGLIWPNEAKKGKAVFNAAALVQKNKIVKIFKKELLPSYDVFDETRHIQSGKTKDNVFTFKGKKMLLTICEDIWAWEDPKLGLNLTRASIYAENPLQVMKKQKLDLVINISGSPFVQNKITNRRTVVAKTAKQLKCPMIYTNLVGAQDEQIYDGQSFAVDAQGQLTHAMKAFEPDFAVVELFTKTKSKKIPVPKIERIEDLRKGLILGIHDFVTKVGMGRVHLGSSGGVDSAVVACLAVEALGAKNVTTVYMPGPFSSDESLQLASQLQKNLKCEWHEISIQHLYEQFLRDFQSSIGGFEFGLTNENLQARLRAVFLMAYSNLKESMLLNTSNKSELAMGYSTIYGDLCGGLCPLGDVVKQDVFALAEYYCEEKNWMPRRVIERAPSAELRPNQKDEDTLPPYKELDPVVSRLVEDRTPAKSEIEKRVIKALYQFEYKRWQAPPILKVTNHAFGRGRRFPIAHRVRS